MNIFIGALYCIGALSVNNNIENAIATQANYNTSVMNDTKYNNSISNLISNEIYKYNSSFNETNTVKYEEIDDLEELISHEIPALILKDELSYKFKNILLSNMRITYHIGENNIRVFVSNEIKPKCSEYDITSLLHTLLSRSNTIQELYQNTLKFSFFVYKLKLYKVINYNDKDGFIIQELHYD